jgi:hypothetical protein
VEPDRGLLHEYVRSLARAGEGAEQQNVGISIARFSEVRALKALIKLEIAATTSPTIFNGPR